MKDKYYERYMLEKYYKRGYLARDIGGYSVIDRGSDSGYGEYINYKELEELRYMMERNEYEEPETEQEKSARLLREKAIERENKIDKLLGNDGL